MYIEALLKLKCQQALAQGDYDSLSSYSQQLIMFQQGTLLGEMPIGEELKALGGGIYLVCAWLPTFLRPDQAL